MRDHATEELISAYVDGELEGDELKLVEDLLAKSPEHLQLLEEFQGLRASMWSLPSFKLSDDFHSRVVSQIDEIAVPPPEEPVRRASSVSETRPWGSVILAATSLAAMVAVTVMLRPPALSPSIPDRAERVTPPVVMPVYLQQEPRCVMVFEITMTRAAQEAKLPEKLLQNVGIGVDPALRLDSNLEKSLMALRLTRGVDGPHEAVPLVDPSAPNKRDEDVEMIYAASQLKVFDRFYAELNRMRSARQGAQVSDVHFTMVYEPNQMGVMHRLHDSARNHFAQGPENLAPDKGQAYRLSFSFELTSVSIPGSASFPVPIVHVERAVPDASPSALTPDVISDENSSIVDAFQFMSRMSREDVNGAGEPSSEDDDEWVPWGDDPGYALLIIRYTDGQAADAKMSVED